MNKEEKIPPPVSDTEKWIVHSIVVAIRVEHRQTGTDTAETYVHLENSRGEKRVWKDSTFKSVARLNLDWIRICEPVYGLREKVEAREKYEKANQAEIATYKRLKAKFEVSENESQSTANTKEPTQ